MLYKKLLKGLTTFYCREDGAITVDFVALTAVICLLGVLVVGAFQGEVVRIADDTGSFIARQLDDE